MLGEFVDDTTNAVWIQAGSAFVDLRTPAHRQRCKATSLSALNRADLIELAKVQGFAGEFRASAHRGRWDRLIDFQPASVFEDVSDLELDGDLLIERGVQIPFLERWRRAASDGRMSGALFLRRLCDDRSAVFVRAGDQFGFARARSEALPPHTMLAELIAAAPLDHARAMLDCVIAIGTIKAERWTIDDATLPWLAGRDLTPSGYRHNTAIVLNEQDDQHAVHGSSYAILEQEGRIFD